MPDEPILDDDDVRIDVTADKPGRWIGVNIAQGLERDGDHHPWNVALSIEQGTQPAGSDPWTWLTPDEARLVATALVEAADRADVLRARDPRAEDE